MLSTFVKILQLAPTDWLFKSTKSVMVFENVWAHELKWCKTILNKHCKVEAGCVLGVSVNFISTWQIMPAWSGYISEIFSMILRFLSKIWRNRFIFCEFFNKKLYFSPARFSKNKSKKSTTKIGASRRNSKNKMISDLFFEYFN